MLTFVNSWFGPRCNPIGVDFGSDCLRMAQVQWTGEEYRLIAAASADVPGHVRKNAGARLMWFADTARDLLSQGNFKGRQAVLALPAAAMFVRHLKMDKLDDDELKKALPWELRGKLPIDPSHAVLRHVIAGEIYAEQDPKYEVIVMAASKELVNQLLSAAAKAKLDIIGMNVEPKALIDCFSSLYRRKTDEGAVSCYVDIGCSASRAVVAKGPEMLFARTIPVGGDHFSRAVADGMKISFEQAKVLRVKLACSGGIVDEQRERTQVRVPEGSRAEVKPAPTPIAAGAEENSFALLNNALAASEQQHAAPVAPPVEDRRRVTLIDDDEDPQPIDEAQAVESACRDPLNRMIEELNLCRRYYEATFPEKPIDRLVFVGGEARQRSLCQHVAKELQLAAQVGDPLVRMGRISEIGPESGIDRRQPQPGWAVALGLSMGPAQNGASRTGGAASDQLAASGAEQR